MSDGKARPRPISPHMTVWRWQLNAIMSILHRATGVAMAAGAVLIVWWFLAASSGEAAFVVADGIMTSWLGGLIMIGFLFALWYHFCNGIRHLFWDTGLGFELDDVEKSGVIACAAAAALTVFTLIVM